MRLARPPPSPPRGVATVLLNQRTGPAPCPAGGHPGRGSCCFTGQQGCCGGRASQTPAMQTVLELGAPAPLPLSHLLPWEPTPERVGQELPAVLWRTRAGWRPRSRGRVGGGGTRDSPPPAQAKTTRAAGGGGIGDPSGRAWASGEIREPARWIGHACRALPGPPQGGARLWEAGPSETAGDPALHNAASSARPQAGLTEPGGHRWPGRAQRSLSETWPSGRQRAAPGTFQVRCGHAPPGPDTWEALSWSLIDLVHTQHHLFANLTNREAESR